MSTITMAHIKARCIEEGDCWIWQGSVLGNGYPSMSIKDETYLVRRVVLEIVGKPPKKYQPVICSCRNKLCVNPEHLTRSSHSKVGRDTAALGVFSELTKCAKNAKASRARESTRLTMELANEIRLRPESGKVLSGIYGVSKNQINAIKRGDAWKDYTPSPFAGLGAR